MARPRQFDEDAVLDAAMQRFWNNGYEATSMRDLAEVTGLTTPSLYNAFGDKRAIYRLVLDRYLRLTQATSAAIFGSGAATGMNTVVRQPSSDAASATPCAWLPADAATTPLARSSSVSRAIRT